MISHAPTRSIWLRLAKLCFAIWILTWLAACSSLGSGEVSRIALLAPFEGRYREIGYNALYAARLAIDSHHDYHIDLLAVDDGGSIESAVDRARAILRDPEIVAVLALGPHASHADVQLVLRPVPVFIIGFWGSTPVQDSIAVLYNKDLPEYLSVNADLDIVELAALDAPFSGSDLLGLAQFPLLRDELTGIRLISSGSLPSEDFRERYLAQGDFVPEPNLLASLTYDATQWIIMAILNDQDLNTFAYEGLNGLMSVEDNYWHEAPINTYQFDAEGTLIPFELNIQREDSTTP